MTMRDLTVDCTRELGEPRSRTVTWYDPAIGAGEGLAMAGLDYLQAMIDRALPPPPIGPGQHGARRCRARPRRVHL